MAQFDNPSPDDDEEAFHWAGDEVSGREGARIPGTTAPDAAADTEGEPAPAAPATGRGAAPVTILFALLYVVLTVGWILATGDTAAPSLELVPQILWQFGEFTAIIAAPMWFGTTVLLTPSRLGVRIGFLLLGLGVLLPWPLLPRLVVGA